MKTKKKSKDVNKDICAKAGVELRRKAVFIDAVPTFIFSAELIPYRLPGSVWADRLEKLKAAGLNTVGLYFAWNFHSDKKGVADFASPDRDLARLLDLAEGLGLHVIARPGPYVCNEWDLGGYPAWLLKEDKGDWRHGNPKHLSFCREWYRQVNAVLAGKQHSAGGPIILYQIENEHRWNDRDFLAGLCDAAREDGIAVPLVGNHDGGGLCVLDKLAEGTDIYTPVFEFCRWRGWLESLNRRIGSELPLMVLEYRCGEHPLWGQATISQTWPPAHWTLSQTRLFTAVGANVVNHFVGAGGITPVGFNSDHIITSYVDNPPVTPWGELTERFYEMRLLGLFQESFNRALAESVPTAEDWRTDNVQVECLARRGEKGTFLVLANHSNTTCEFRIFPDAAKTPLCSKAIGIGPFRTKLLLADAELSENIKIVFCPLQILSAWTEGDASYLIVYGDPGEQGDITFSGGGETHIVHVTCTDTVVKESAIIAGKKVTVYATTSEVAARTWLPRNTANIVMPLFGKIPLMRPQTAAGAALRIELPSVEDAFKLIVPANFAASMRLDGVPAAAQKARPDGLTEIAFPLTPAADPSAMVGKMQFAAIDDSWTTMPPKSEYGWRQVNAWGENAEVLIEPGDYEWRTDFTATAPLPETLEFLGVSQAEITVFLNGSLLGSYPSRRVASTNQLPSFNAVFDVRNAIRSGSNQLAVHMHFHGRHNSGHPIYVGFSQPVLLRHGQSDEQIEPLWKVSPVTSRKWSVAELDAVPAMDAKDWEEVDLSRRNEHMGPAGTKQHHEVRWYRRTVNIPESFRGKPLFLECPPVEEAWAYVDGRRLGRTHCGSSTIFDLSSVSDRESVELTLAVRQNWFFWNERFGLPGAPRLLSPGQPLEATWSLRGRALSESDPWRAMGVVWVDEQTAVKAVRRVLARCPVNVSAPSNCAAPLFVELDNWVSRAVLYWNGKPIGLYSEVGPQKRFYIPEEMIKSENTVHVLVDGYCGSATAGTLSAGFYFTNRCVSLSL